MDFSSIFIPQINANLVPVAEGQAMYLVQSEPKLATQITKAILVVLPTEVEIDRAVHPLLDHRPTAAGCLLVTIHEKSTCAIRVDFIDATGFVTNVIQLGTILLDNCK